MQKQNIFDTNELECMHPRLQSRQCGHSTHPVLHFSQNTSKRINLRCVFPRSKTRMAYHLVFQRSFLGIAGGKASLPSIFAAAPPPELPGGTAASWTGRIPSSSPSVASASASVEGPGPSVSRCVCLAGQCRKSGESLPTLDLPKCLISPNWEWHCFSDCCCCCQHHVVHLFSQQPTAPPASFFGYISQAPDDHHHKRQSLSSSTLGVWQTEHLPTFISCKKCKAQPQAAHP